MSGRRWFSTWRGPGLWSLRVGAFGVRVDLTIARAL
jgi:hypothetical protein